MNVNGRITISPSSSEQDSQRVLIEWNATERSYPQRCVHEMFAEQARLHPQALAVVYEDQRLSYGELEARSNQLAHYLRSMGVGAETIVGLCVERSLEMVIGLLGILKAGAAYLPLDPGYPAERLKYVLQQSAPVLVLRHCPGVAVLAECFEEVPVVELQADELRWASQPSQTPTGVGVGLQNLAYVIYTSGSSGRPKGVLVGHGNLANLIGWHCEAFGLVAGERVSGTASFGFDAAVSCIRGKWRSKI